MITLRITSLLYHKEKYFKISEQKSQRQASNFLSPLIKKKVLKKTKPNFDLS
jgi:hypothetical protein